MINDMMFELALVAQAFGMLAEMAGWEVVQAEGFGQAQWLYIETPAGQVGFGIKDAHWVKDFEGSEELDPWDGHGWEEKMRRLTALLQSPVEDEDERET